MLNHQTFSFGEVPDAVRLSISEGDIPGDEFGLHVWPSGRVLAYYLWDLRTTVEFDKLRVLELGCGVSISGLLAAKLGANVVLTDRADKDAVLALNEANATKNSVSDRCTVVGLTWGDFTSSCVPATSKPLPSQEFDYILGADIFYDTALFEDALATVAYFMNINPSCAFITTFQHRSATQTIAPLLQRFGLHAEVVRSGSHYCHLFPEGNTAIASVSVIEIVTKTKHAQGQYARDGYTVLEGVLTADMLAAIHSESDRLCAAIPSERLVAYLVERMCVMDMLESIPVPEDHPSRTSACAYRELREKATLSSSSAVSDVVLSHLPKAVSAVTGWRHIRLFNEHYILKPPKTVSEFRWHRDADLQLAACFVPSEYTSVWCALDAVHPHNGTLTLIPLSDVGAGETVSADVDNTDPTHDPCSAVTVTLSAGDAVVFDSAVWHRSGPNLSDSIRRVLYAQYSPGVVTTSGLKDDGGKPICFAVPCERE